MNCYFEDNAYTGSIIFPDDEYKFKNDDVYIDFTSSHKFNGFVQIPKGIKSCTVMFDSCEEFNQPIIIPEGVVRCEYMFVSCYNLSYPVIFPESVTNCHGALMECYKVPDVYILNTSYPHITSLVYGHKDAKRIITIHCPDLSIINKTDAEHSVVGNEISYDNNWYSSEYKVQLTTDMNGVI